MKFIGSKVRIYLCYGNTAVTKKFLYFIDGYSLLNKPRSERVAEAVEMQSRVQTRSSNGKPESFGKKIPVHDSTLEREDQAIFKVFCGLSNSRLNTVSFMGTARRLPALVLNEPEL